MIPAPERIALVAGTWWVWFIVLDSEGRRRLRPVLVPGTGDYRWDWE